jgi:hypothetical protein
MAEAAVSVPQKSGDEPYKVGPGKPPLHTRFQPGNKANPGGKPVASRNFLQARFLKEMAEDFDKNGRHAIVRMREERPSDYIRAIASLMPKELEVKTTAMDELTDEALDAALVAVQAILEAQGEKVSA